MGRNQITAQTHTIQEQRRDYRLRRLRTQKGRSWRDAKTNKQCKRQQSSHRDDPYYTEARRDYRIGRLPTREGHEWRLAKDSSVDMVSTQPSCFKHKEDVKEQMRDRTKCRGVTGCCMKAEKAEREDSALMRRSRNRVRTHSKTDP